MTPATLGPSRPGPRRLATVYLVRHAIAAERGPDWPDDNVRPLTHKGRARMREVVRGLVALGADIEVVYTSPLVRAAHTAEILAAGLSSRPDVTAMPQLAPGHPPASTADALAERPRVRSVALVGHEPGMGELAAWLLGTPEPPVFKKGGVCCLHTRWPPRPGTSELIWFATPKMLRSL